MMDASYVSAFSTTKPGKHLSVTHQHHKLGKYRQFSFTPIVLKAVGGIATAELIFYSFLAVNHNSCTPKTPAHRKRDVFHTSIARCLCVIQKQRETIGDNRDRARVFA